MNYDPISVFEKWYFNAYYFCLFKVRNPDIGCVTSDLQARSVFVLVYTT